MKTVELNGVVERVSDSEAEKRVEKGWQLIPKRVWKLMRKDRIDTSDIPEAGEEFFKNAKFRRFKNVAEAKEAFKNDELFKLAEKIKK